MRVTRLDWDPATMTGTCAVEKLGPVLKGTAGFTVAPSRALTTPSMVTTLSSRRPSSRGRAGLSASATICVRP